VSIPTRVVVIGLAATLALGGCAAHTGPSSPMAQSRGDSNPLSGSPATSVVQWVAGPRGMSAVIPPGHYQLRLTDGAQAGSWMACDTAQCGTSQAVAAALGIPVGSSSSTIDIGPQTRTIWLSNVIMTSTVEPGIRH